MNWILILRLIIRFEWCSEKTCDFWKNKYKLNKIQYEFAHHSLKTKHIWKKWQKYELIIMSCFSNFANQIFIQIFLSNRFCDKWMTCCVKKNIIDFFIQIIFFEFWHFFFIWIISMINECDWSLICCIVFWNHLSNVFVIYHFVMKKILYWLSVNAFLNVIKQMNEFCNC